MKISSELFVLNHGHDYILYLPLKSIAIIVNTDTIKLLNAINEGESVDTEKEIIKKLTKLGIFEEPLYPFKDSIYKPTDLTFLPSFICNLKCAYCYSYGGDFTTKKISINAANKAIEFILENAIELNKKEISIGFHGGGEPMLYANKAFIENVVEFTKIRANELGIRYYFSAVTNGVDIDKFDINWLKENFTRFSISLDGPPDIQNLQRPRRGSDSDSYTYTLKTIKLFEENNIAYGIRATITKYSVNRMSEIVEHFASISKQKNFHLEPLFECGRCKTSKMEAPSQEEFIDNFIKATEAAKKFDIKLNYSGINDGRISDKFCGAAGDNFFITPDSYVTTCLEACRIDDIENEPFLIGKFNENKSQYEFDLDKINFLKMRKVTNMKTCNDCFCKFSCSGDCLAKVLKNTGDMFDTTNNNRCEINTVLTNLFISQKLC